MTQTPPKTPELQLPWSTSDPADIAELRARLRMMARIRYFEEEVQRAFEKGQVPGTTHLCGGQEAVAVGVNAALGVDDVLSATYRGHGQALARGVDAAALAAELMGKATGVCAGRAGSLNLIDMSRNLIGCFAIIGGSIGAGTGVALALRGSGRVVVSDFGDGAANQGYFFECLNFAKVYELPILFSCQNNGYGEYTPMEQVTAGADIAARAEVFGIPAQKVDGMDVRACFAATRDALARIRAGEGPQFLEFLTYRFSGHSRSDPGLYRPEGELDRWKERDPLLLVRRLLVDELGLDFEEVEADLAVARAEVAAAFDEARAAPYPSPDLEVPEYVDG